jgi:peptidoglycan/xylan/chitin deacetylase (PgdA/CDA1 family)
MSSSLESAAADVSLAGESGRTPVTVPVIQYHMIDRPSPDSRVRGGFTPPERFKKQMTHLQRHGFAFYTAAELIEYFLANREFPPSGIAITFDDGCTDNYSNAFPVLRELGIRATMFVVPSCIGETSDKTLPAGEPPRPHFSREEMLEMSQFGIEFGSHSMNHRLLHEIPLKDAQYEIESAKDYLEDCLQTPCKTFAYPAGYYTPEVERVIESAGHICAFSTTYGPNDRLDLYSMNRMEIFRRDRFICQFARKIRRLSQPNSVSELRQ